jgi:glycosyltransferase involved in cell wall biosynthesis
MLRVGIEAFRIFRKKKHGIDHVAIELIRDLCSRKLDFELFIFCFKGNYSPEHIPNNPNVRFITIPRHPSPVAEQALLPLLAKIYRLDLLHSTGNTSPIFLPCKRIVTLHDIIYLEATTKAMSSASLYQRIGNWYRSLIVPVIIRKADRIITVSIAERKIIENRFPDLAPKISVIYNSCPYQLLQHAAISHPVPKGLRTKEYYFHLGNTDPKKNTERLLVACYNLMKRGKLHFPLVIADIPITNIRRIIYKNNLQGLESMLEPVGYLNHNEIASYYQHSRLFLYPGIRESFGIPLLEAMAFGAPVLAGDIPALKEVGGEAALYVRPDSIEAIEGSILDYESDPRISEQMVKNGYQRLKSFNWSKSANELIEIYTGKEAIIDNGGRLIKKGEPETALLE